MHSLEQEDTPRNLIVGELVALFAAGKFEDALRRAPRSRVTAEQLRGAVNAYGRSLVALPAEGYELIDCVEVRGSNPTEWSVVVPLFTREEGRSDLSLELSMFEGAAGSYSVEIDDIHVL
ncbi:MAG TPA: hypothetical protein PLK42_13930 [Casimicrobium sp.]|jgi:hypothetical protein|nr:hypothetical protein [Casimicrobium sp.]